jgi:autoinducer 2 (AI-2) kinase
MSTGSEPQCRPHLARGVIEGMAYALRANLDQASETTGSRPKAICLTGGISRSGVFVRVLADVLGLPVDVGPTGEATALGAALCAGVAGGVFRDLPEGVRRFAGRLRTVHPEEENSKTYVQGFEGWKRLRAAQTEGNNVAADLILPSVMKAMGGGAIQAGAAYRPRVLVTADMDDEALAALREFADVEYASFRKTMQILSGPALVKALQGFDVFVAEVDVIDARCLQKLPDLRVIATCRGDAVNVDPPACEAYGIPVLNAPGRNADGVAELAIAYMLMLARKLPAAVAFLRQPDVEAGDMGRMGQAFTTFQGRELWRKTVGLVGMGAVGRAVTKRLLSFGARVLVHDPYLPADAVIREGAEPASLEEALEQSDFLSLHAAVTEETTGMIGAAEFARMKEGAFLINTARAALLDEDALVGALQSGRLGGAAMDVFAVEPPGADHPLLTFENVIATPHSGGNTVEVGAHQGRIIAADLRRLLRGEHPHNVLNPKVLERFDWTKPRPEPDTKALERLASKVAPAVTDLERDQAAHKQQAPNAPSTANAAAPVEVDREIRDRMERILRSFVHRLGEDISLKEFSADQDVTLAFTLPDLDLKFHFSLCNGEVSGDMGEPKSTPEVALKLRAEILDGMFTGTINPMQAATTGGLSFQGDTLKAMTLQYIQEDMSRLYLEARDEVGDPGDLASLAGPAGAARIVRPAGPGDIRGELIEIVNELYQSGLITATGGNVSARAPNNPAEIWITPSQLFKGDLRPEILVPINIAGEPIDPASASPSSERLMHCAVFRVRTEATCVVHAHAPHATILANSGLPFLPISTEAAFFGDIPRVPFIMPGTEELANAVEKAIGAGWAVLLQNHGLILAGRTLRRAADMVEIVERTAEVILGCYAVGREPPVLPEVIIASLQKMGDLMA